MSRVARSVTVIPATVNPISHLPLTMQRKRRVAGYARVSTDSEEQQTSYEAQVDYYTHYIQSKPDWEFVKVYTDEGITATNTKKRDGFNQMVADALAGKIDLIVTKSVSRFARNTVDSLTTVRKLKEKGVEVYFEKENIYTLDSKGELLITIMSSLAQEESRSISENVTWGKRKQLTEDGIPTPSGKSKWSPSTIESILSNVEIDFPYHTEQKVVLYGGFSSFHQEMKRLIPNLRIIPHAAHLDLQPFRNADIIFLQINKTSHSNYWNVCDTAKGSGVPYYHLNNNSARLP